jgi:hypothetical protein
MLFSELVELMEGQSMKVAANADRQFAMAIFGSSSGPKTLMVSLRGGLVQFRVPLAVSFDLVPQERKLALMSQLMRLNYENTLSKIAVDDTDGEMVVYTDVLIGDQALDEQMLHRAVGASLSASDEATQALATAMRGEGIHDRRRAALEQIQREFGDDASASDGTPGDLPLLEEVDDVDPLEAGPSSGEPDSPDPDSDDQRDGESHAA